MKKYLSLVVALISLGGCLISQEARHKQTVEKLESLNGGAAYSLRKPSWEESGYPDKYTLLEYSPERGLVLADITQYTTMVWGRAYLDKDGDGTIDSLVDLNRNAVLGNYDHSINFEDLKGSECNPTNLTDRSISRCFKLNEWKKAQAFYEDNARLFLNQVNSKGGQAFDEANIRLSLSPEEDLERIQ